MLKIEDLRFRNYVKDYAGRIITVKSISEEFIGCFENHSDYLYDDVEGIPLTEQWLLDLGDIKWFGNNTFEIQKNYDGSFSLYAWRKGKSIFIRHLEYVHILQNIYYLLTGEELELK